MSDEFDEDEFIDYDDMIHHYGKQQGKSLGEDYVKTCTVCEQKSFDKGKHVPLEDCVRALALALEKTQRELADARQDIRSARAAQSAALYVANLSR